MMIHFKNLKLSRDTFINIWNLLIPGNRKYNYILVKTYSLISIWADQVKFDHLNFTDNKFISSSSTKIVIFFKYLAQDKSQSHGKIIKKVCFYPSSTRFFEPIVSFF